MLRTNTVFCCHRNEIIARLKEDFGYETRLPLTGPIANNPSGNGRMPIAGQHPKKITGPRTKPYSMFTSL